MAASLSREEVLRIGYPRESSLYKLDKDGKPATKFSPTNVGIAPNGDIYLADGYGSDTISQYDPRGRYIRTFGGTGKEPGQLSRPHGLIVDTRAAPSRWCWSPTGRITGCKRSRSTAATSVSGRASIARVISPSGMVFCSFPIWPRGLR